MVDLDQNKNQAAHGGGRLTCYHDESLIVGMDL